MMCMARLKQAAWGNLEAFVDQRGNTIPREIIKRIDMKLKGGAHVKTFLELLTSESVMEELGSL